MTAKEKAYDLFTTFRFVMAHPGAPFGIYKDDIAKQSALVCVDEILSMIEFSSQADELSKTTYWNSVKDEIEKL